MGIPSAVFPQIVGKNNCNLAAIRQATSTQIDIDRHSKQSSNRTVTVRYDNTMCVHVEFTTFSSVVSRLGTYDINGSLFYFYIISF